jgi:hypothetical protein
MQLIRSLICLVIVCFLPCDAVSNLLVCVVVTLWAIKVARKPKDKEFPYGRGKFETLGTFILGMCSLSAHARATC